MVITLKRGSEAYRKWFFVDCRLVGNNNNNNNNNNTKGNNKISRSKQFPRQGFAKALRFAFSLKGFAASERLGKMHSLFGIRKDEWSASAAPFTGSGSNNKRGRRMNIVVCEGTNRLNGLRFAATVSDVGNGVTRAVSFREGEGNASETNGVAETMMEGAGSFPDVSVRGAGLRSTVSRGRASRDCPRCCAGVANSS